jgi:hypothetical protein
MGAPAFMSGWYADNLFHRRGAEAAQDAQRSVKRFSLHPLWLGGEFSLR